MFHSQRGSAAAWVVLVLILLVAAAAVLYLTVFKDDEQKTESSSAGDVTPTQSQQNQDSAAGQGGTGGGSTDTGAGAGQEQGTGQGGGQVTPGSNVREPVTVADPPIESGEEARLAVMGASTEALDWYWAVDDPRYEATDWGSYYVVRLYSVVPAEGNSPEHQADFGRFRVDKQTGTVSEMTK